MLYFIFALINLIIATALLTMCIIVIYRHSFKTFVHAKGSISIIILSIILILISSWLFYITKIEVESNAIDHYIVGDVEIIEKLDSNGDVIDWRYKILPVEYE